jgi:hypothetical protein
VLRVREVYPGSWIRIFSIPDPGSGSTFTSKNLSILTQKIVSKLSEIWSGMFITDPEPGLKKAPDPGSATLIDSGREEEVERALVSPEVEWEALLQPGVHLAFNLLKDGQLGGLGQHANHMERSHASNN